MFWSAFVYSSNGDFIDSAVCDTVGIGQEIHYKAEISISSCELGNRHKRFKIKPADLSDSMIVDVEINCACECHDEVRCRLLYFCSTFYNLDTSRSLLD